MEGWWVKGGRQEGCNFKPTSMDQVIPLVKRSLVQKGLTATRLSAAECVGGEYPKGLCAILARDTGSS